MCYAIHLGERERERVKERQRFCILILCIETDKKGQRKERHHIKPIQTAHMVQRNKYHSAGDKEGIISSEGALRVGVGTCVGVMCLTLEGPL